MNNLSKKVVAHGQTWRKVNRPEPWRPDTPGQELIGKYVGRVQASGQYGEYEKVLVSTGKGVQERVYSLTGWKVVDLFTGIAVAADQHVRVVFLGWITTHDDHKMRNIELYIEA